MAQVEIQSPQRLKALLASLFLRSVGHRGTLPMRFASHTFSHGSGAAWMFHGPQIAAHLDAEFLNYERFALIPFNAKLADVSITANISALV